MLEFLLGRRQLYRLGRKLYLYARRDGGGDPARNGEYGLHERLARLAAIRDKPFTVIDVGANTGYWSSHLLRACQAAGVGSLRLWAFEPSDEIRVELIDQLKSVPPNYQVKVRPEAVANVSGRVGFGKSESVVGTKRLQMGLPSATSTVVVPVTTLTAVFAEEGIQEADFVKSDVEGFDLQVLQGALPLLRDGRIGLFQFEYNHCWVATRSFLHDVFDLTEGLPYRLCKIIPAGLDAYNAWHPELETFFDTNFVLVRDDLIAPLGVREGRFDATNAYTSNERVLGS